jgi:C-terminal processing protease CtpA/Prc
MRIMVALLLVLSGLVSFGQEISGVGVLLRQQGHELMVAGVLPNSPAAASKGIHQGDRLIAVAQGEGKPVPLTGLGLAEAARLIRGPKGTLLRVTVVPAGKDDSEVQVIKLVRGQLDVPMPPEDFDPDGIGFSLWLMKLGMALAHP